MRALFIVGPTACGKSALAAECARRTGSEIISCDSMQIYRHMDIGTAKTTEAECGVPVHMVDIVEPNDEFSAFEYAERALEVAKTLDDSGKLPIFAGGTGLYAHSTIFPLTFGAAKDENVRAELERELDRRGAQAMWEELASLDPDDAAKIHPNNVKRLLRALEIARVSGETKPKGESLKPRFAVKMIFLKPPRDALYAAIDDRVERMFEAGLEEEVRRLVDERGLDFGMQSMQAIGYREFAPYLSGEISLSQLKERIKLDTHRYAKRQETWFSRYKFAIQADPFALATDELAALALSDDGYFYGEENAEDR